MNQDPYKVYRNVARLGGLLLLVLGTLVLVGWIANIGFLTTVLAGGVAMKPNTAIGFLFLGVALLLLTRSTKTRSAQLWCAVSATVVITVGLLTSSEYLFHIDLGIDQLLFRDLLQSPYPGRMAPIAAVSFCMAGLSALLLALSEKRANISQALATRALSLPSSDTCTACPRCTARSSTPPWHCTLASDFWPALSLSCFVVQTWG